MATLPSARHALHVAAPFATALVLGAFVIFAPPSSSGLTYEKNPTLLLCRRLVLGSLVALFAAQCVAIAVTTDSINRVQDQVLHVVGLALVWAVEFVRAPSNWELGTVSLVTVGLEVSTLVLSIVHPDAAAGHTFRVAQLVLQAACLGLLAYLIADAGVGLLTGAGSPSGGAPDAEASEPLLHANGETNGYGAVPPSTAPKKDGQDEDEEAEDPSDVRFRKRREERLKEAGGWFNYVKDFKVFLPFINPAKEPRVILCLLVVGLCIISVRFMNVIVPRQLGIITDKLLGGEAPYKELAVFLVLSLADSSTGIYLIERLAKIPVRQFAMREITNAAFRHVMSLSMDFHSERDTAEIQKAVDQGSSVAAVLEWVVVDIAPNMLDVLVAMWLLYYKFNIYFSLCIVVSAVIFLSVEVYMSGNNRGNRRKLQKLSRETTKRMHQAVQNWQTVAYFNMADFEANRYSDSVVAEQQMAMRYNSRDAFNEALLQGLVPITFFGLAVLVMNEIFHGRATPGDFVFLLQYWDHIIYPLKQLSWQYKYLMEDLVDAERLLELLQTIPSVPEKEGAIVLPRPTGHVTFSDVGFAYDPRKKTLANINMDVNRGQTFAFVGATGAGKSSIIKLLHRFYDVTSGSIRIDGHDIRDVTVGSLRDSLGVVPQDPMLFNTSVMDNVRYARITATDEEVYEACRSAAIHDKIMTFADGYKTVVGDNGVKLSGGEAQRVAIARVFLKNPPILILDEATSAIDTNTEMQIQAALDALKKQRTTFVIAHRLSTIVDSDAIMVVEDGEIMERGTHFELLDMADGRYKKLWEIQSRAVMGRKKVDPVEDLIVLDKDEGKSAE